jgi:hypothetical protein
LFKWALAFAVEIAVGSTSIRTMRRAPKHLAARARIPLPVPRSTTNFGSVTSRHLLKQAQQHCCRCVLTRAKSCASGNNQTAGKAASFPFCRRTNNHQLFPDSKRLGFLLVRKSLLANRVVIFWRVRQILGRASATHFVTCTRSRSARAFAQAARWSPAHRERGLAIFLRGRSASTGPLLFATDTLIPLGRPAPSLRNDECRSYFFSGAFSSFIFAIFWARPAANFSYWTLSIVNVPNI